MEKASSKERTFEELIENKKRYPKASLFYINFYENKLFS